MSTQAVVPSWETQLLAPSTALANPDRVQTAPRTPWEAVLRFEDSKFPIRVGDREFSKQELLARAADILNGGDPASAIAALGADGLAKIRELCRQPGLLTSRL